jgi:hypothetical protein
VLVEIYCWKKGDPIIESGNTLELCEHKHARKHELFCMDGQLLSESSSSVYLEMQKSLEDQVTSP